MNIRRNCGVFDEQTKKCIACGETQEGPQCEYIVWTLPQCMYYAAQLLGIPTSFDTLEGRVRIESDSNSLRLYGLQFDPHRIPGHLQWLIERLVTNHRCWIQFNHDTMLYEVLTRQDGRAYIEPGSPDTVKYYNLNVAHRLFTHAIIIAAGKHYCHQMQLPLPHNLMENKL